MANLLVENLSDFHPEIIRYNMEAGNRTSWTEQDYRLLVTRSFCWFSNERSLRFTDLEVAMTAIMPMIGGAFSYVSGNEKISYLLEDLHKFAMVMAFCLEGGQIELAEYEVPANVISNNMYTIKEWFEEDKELSLLSLNKLAMEAHEHLVKVNDNESLREILNMTEHERIENFSEKVTLLTACGDVAYSVTRDVGDKMTKVIESLLDEQKLLPAHISGLLRALDAFPKNKQVLALYESVLAKNKSTYLEEKIKKYQDCVKKGEKVPMW